MEGRVSCKEIGWWSEEVLDVSTSDEIEVKRFRTSGGTSARSILDFPA